MCAVPLSFRFSLDFAYFPSILVLSRERRARKGITYMKKLITIILALIMTIFTAPTEIDDHPVEDYVGEGEDRPGEGKHF